VDRVIDFITSITLLEAIIAGVVVVLFGLLANLVANRAKLLEQKRYEAVEEVISLARQFREIFSMSRKPLAYSFGKENRPRDTGETPEKSQVLDEEYACRASFQQAAEILVKLQRAVQDAEIVTGEKITPIVKPFSEVIHELDGAIHDHFTYRLRLLELSPGEVLNPAYAEKHNKAELLYVFGPDELNSRVDNALEVLEQRLRKYLS